MVPDLNYLKENCKLIHYFGLGFIQIKLSDSKRIHFYTDKYPILTEDVHDHRYSFISKILSGTFIQNIYEVVPGDDYLLEQESCNPNNKIECKPKECNVRLLTSIKLEKNSDYFLDHRTFHTVSANHGTITLIERSQYHKELANVIRLKGSEKICPFSLKVSEEDLWQEVERILNEL